MRLIGVLLLAAVTAAVFLPVARGGFVYDDQYYLLDNKALLYRPWAPFTAWAFTAFHEANWHPVTWLSHKLDFSLFGLTPAGHHLSSLLVHAANAALLFLLLAAMTGAPWRAWLAAAVFALHPLHVESVAWVSERKDLLAGLFFILALGAWLRYARRPAAGRYLAAAALLALGLMSKPMLVTAPLVLLVLDWWPLGRLRPGTARRLVLEKLPLAALCAASGVLTFLAQRSAGAVQPFQKVTAAGRAANAVVAYASYLARTAWPSGLSVYYPLPVGGHPAWKVALSLAVLAGISWAAARAVRARPAIAAGWLWYLVTLLPVIGLVQVGGQAMADRYTYLPMIGLLAGALWWAGPPPRPGLRARRLAAAGAAVLLLALSLASARRVPVWRDAESLWGNALAATRDNWMANFALGKEMGRQGRRDEAVAYLRESIRLLPEQVSARNDLGVQLALKGDREEAAREFMEALRYGPEDAAVHYNLGVLMAEEGQVERAAELYRLAVQKAPDMADAHNNLGVIYMKRGMAAEAAAEFRLALAADPGHRQAAGNLRRAMSLSGHKGY